MTGREEKGVDDSVATAWVQFRVRLADHLADLPGGQRLLLRVDAAALSVQMRERDGAIAVTWVRADDSAHPEVDQLLVSAGDVDAFALTVQHALLAAGALHPAFVDVLEGDLALADPPTDLVDRPVPAAVPECARPQSPEQLAAWVRLVATAWLGHEPEDDKSADDGAIRLTRDDDALIIGVSEDRPTVEVLSTVARGVDRAKARKIVAKLGARWHFLSFSLQGDRVVVSISVDASPFVPDHLERAIDTVFGYLAHHGARLRAKVAPPRPGADVRRRVDPDLLLLFAAAPDQRAVADLARELSGDSSGTLRRWRVFATINAARARARSRSAQHGPVRRLLIEQADTWHAVASALEAAADQAAGKRTSS